MSNSRVRLNEQEARWLSGADGKAMQFAMELMVSAARIAEATEFVPIDFAHINSCHYSGQLSVDFAEFLLAEGAHLAVRTHTNASLIDCSNPHLRPEDQTPTEVAGAKRLMAIYEELGCSTMWSCAPYQHDVGRPALGQQIIGSESNAVSFFNSVLGARTNKYGDILDVCGAMIGRVPFSGLHTDEGRLATHLVRVGALSTKDRADPAFPHLLGILLGELCGTAVPVVDGLELLSTDDLKAIAAAAATSGSVAMFHVVGITPEAPTLADALGSRAPAAETTIDASMLSDTRAQLTTGRISEVNAVCLGTPHFSITEFEELRRFLDGRRCTDDVAMLVTTSREIAAELKLRGWMHDLEASGVRVVLDTCTYFTPRASGVEGTVMTNSAKWAYYAPGILGVSVVFATLEECVGVAIREVAR